MEKKILKTSTSPFIGRSDGEVFEGQKFPEPKDDVIVEYTEVKECVKTGEGKHDFKVVKSLTPTSKTNRADYINSFTGDVGIMNVLKKVLVGGQTIDDVVKSGKFASSQQGLVDLSKMPDNIVDAYKKVESGVKAFDELPENVKKKQSFAHFAETFDQNALNDYIAGEVKKYLASQKKEG